MCGIAGYLNLDTNKAASIENLKKMTDIIAHRGPDGEGFYIKNNVALGHRRLSIIDLNSGDQPFFNEDRSIVIVFNGEIYNYIELREDLKKLGHKFYSESDTEVIIRAYEQWGVDCQNKLNGMWAFALWDEKNKTLFISRDRMGEKPLHFANYDNTFIFGSEIKSILQYGVPRIPNTEVIELYLAFSYIPAPYSGFKNVFKLRPGYFLLIKDGQVNEKQYWDLPAIDENNMLRNKAEIHKKFNELFIDSVAIRMRSDVPFGAFLSGGLDSSAVVATMSELSKYPVETFTMSFEDKAFDESELAQDVANKFKTSHNVNMIKPDSFNESLNLVAFHYDEPFGDSSAIPTGYVSKYARQKVKMVLTGDGGDEVLSGYPSYQGVKLTNKYRKLPSLFRSSIPHVLSVAGAPLTGKYRYKINKIRSACVTANLDFNARMVEKFPCIDLPIVKALYQDNNRIKVEDYFNDFMSKCSYKDDFYKLMYYDLKLNLPEDMLAKVDRMSMAHSLETRIPFLDPRLIELMVTVDKNIKMEGLERKSILRKTIGQKLPDSILNAPKRGFGVPVREWFKDNAFEAKLQSLHTNDFGLDSNVIKSIIEKNKEGKQDNGNFIWMLFVLKNWLNA